MYCNYESDYGDELKWIRSSYKGLLVNSASCKGSRAPMPLSLPQFCCSCACLCCAQNYKSFDDNVIPLTEHGNWYKCDWLNALLGFLGCIIWFWLIICRSGERSQQRLGVFLSSFASCQSRSTLLLRPIHFEKWENIPDAFCSDGGSASSLW